METLLESLVITLVVMIICIVTIKKFTNVIFKTVNYIVISLLILILSYTILHTIMIKSVTVTEESWQKIEIMSCSNNDSTFKFYMDKCSYYILCQDENKKFKKQSLSINQVTIQPTKGNPYLEKKVFIKHINKSKNPDYFWNPKDITKITSTSFCGCGDEYILHLNKYAIDDISNIRRK